MSVKEDFKSMEDMLRTVNTQMRIMEEMYDDEIVKEYGLSLTIKNTLKGKTKEDIENMEDHDILRVLNDSSTKDFDCKEGAEKYFNALEDNEKTFTEVMKDVFIHIVDYLESYHSLLKDTRRIQNQITDAYNDYFAHINSPEMQEERQKALDKMREDAENETVEWKKNAIIRKLDAMENAKNLKFLLTRLHDIGDKEAHSIVDTFFDDNRSSIIMKKYRTRMKHLGFNPDVFNKFYNIEENFLPEEYADLNNIFLFHIMRYISYVNTDDQIDSFYARAIINGLYKLVYHKYDSPEQENEIIALICEVDDYFMYAHDKFAEKNITSPNHPKRKAADEEHEQRERMMLISTLENRGETVDSTQDTEVLRKQLSDLIEAENNALDAEIEADDRAKEEEASEQSVLDAFEDDYTADTEDDESDEEDDSDELVEEHEDYDTPEPPTWIGDPPGSESKDESMIVDVRGNNDEDDDEIIGVDVDELMSGADTVSVEKITVYADKFGCTYRLNTSTNMYDYYDEDGRCVEGQSVDETTFLQLLSGGNLNTMDIDK